MARSPPSSSAAEQWNMGSPCWCHSYGSRLPYSVRGSASAANQLGCSGSAWCRLQACANSARCAALHPAGATDLFGSTDEQRLMQAQQRLQRLAAARLQAPPQQTPTPPQSTSTPTPLPPPSPPSPPVQRRRIVRALAAPGAAADLALVRFVGIAPPEYTVNVLATSRARIGGADGCGVRVRARARLPTVTGTATLNTARSLTRSLARHLTRSLARSLT